MTTPAHKIRDMAVALIGEEAVRKLAGAGLGLINVEDYRRFITQKQRESGRLRDVSAAACRTVGAAAMRAELREEDGIVSCIVTHPGGDEQAVARYLGELLRTVVAERHGKPVEGDVGRFDVPAAYVPGRRFPSEDEPGSGNALAGGCTIYGDGAHVVLGGVLEFGADASAPQAPLRVLVPGKHHAVTVQIGDETMGGLYATITDTEEGWYLVTQRLGVSGEVAIPWEVLIRGDEGTSPRLEVDCPEGTPVAWMVR